MLDFHHKIGHNLIFLGEGGLCPVAPLVAQRVKRLPAMQETEVRSLGWEDPLEKEVATHSSILPGDSHGQGSLTGYSPWVRKELDTTE